MTEGGEEVEAALVLRAAAGDRDAFGLILNRTKATLYAFVRRSVGDADEAYDILQDAFLAAWLGLGRFDVNRPVLPWLRTIALNKCRDYGRRNAVRRVMLRARAQEAPEPTRYEGEDSDARLDALDRAILSLPGFYREPLLLTSVNGLSHAETAAILKTSPKAVEMRVRRAKQRLSALLEEKPEG